MPHPSIYIFRKIFRKENKMKKILLALALLGVLCLTGCAGYMSPVVPPFGCIYSDIKAPLSHEVNGAKVGSKVGTAEATSVLGIIALGDCSINTAAKNGGIETVTFADYDYTNILFGFFQSYKTRVYGD